MALGRKNRIHVWNAQAGPKVAAILSVVESCCRMGIAVRLSGVSIQRIAQFTPAAWAARNL